MISQPLTSPWSVELEGLTFAYGGGSSIIDIPTLALARGRRIFLHGPSGSGKTTVLGLIAGILTPTTGVVRVLGQDLAALKSSRKDRFRGDHCGYIFQMFNLLPYLNVRENILLPCRMSALRMQRLKAQGETEETLLDIAGSLGIAAFLDRKVTDLSVGQQQRVAAARALVGSPEIIIADEPTSALDIDHREAFLTLLFKEAEKSKTTILFVSHDHTLKSLFDEAISLKEINRVRV